MKSSRKKRRAMLLAISMFSIIPVRSQWEESSARLVPRFFPLVGLLLGVLWWGVAELLRLVPPPPALAAALLLAVPVIFTGMIHLDGFLDCCDAVFSHRDQEGMRRILKDPACGPFAVVSACMLFLLLWTSFYELWQGLGIPWAVWVLEPVAARALTAWALQTIRPISETGFAAAFHTGRQLDQLMALTVFLLTGILLSALVGTSGAGAFVCASAAFLLGLWLCRKLLGGISGDVCGFCLTLFDAGFFVVYSWLWQ